MNIIIPLGGKGERFINNGYILPKPLIKVFDKEMILYVLDNLKIRHFFDAIVSANDVIISKPHPETFLKAAELLHTNPVDCLVFEDVPKGAEAAFNAGMNTIILTTTHEKNEFFHLPNVKHFCKDFNDEFITNLIPTN